MLQAVGDCCGMLGAVGNRGEETGCWLMRVSQTPKKVKRRRTNLELRKDSYEN